MTFLNFINVSTAHPHRVTKTFDVFSVTGNYLGIIQWHAAWRRYCFYPQGNTVFDASCLSIIKSEIEILMNARKENNETTNPLGK